MAPTPNGKDWMKLPLRLVLFGGPGAGKGTQAEILRERLNVQHFSTGELFRGIIKNGATSPATREALECINSGCLVPDTIVIEMVREIVKGMDPNKGVLLDGFPRTIVQAIALDCMLTGNQKLDAVLDIELPQSKLIERLSGRRTCAQCGASYHVISRPPKVKNVCDACGGKLVQRNDDQPEAIHVRLDVYQKETSPLIDFYKNSDRLITIPGEGAPEEVAERILGLLEQKVNRK